MVGLRVRTATYFSAETSFKLETVRGGHWHTKPSSFSSADVYSDKPTGSSGRRDLDPWGSRGRMTTAHESLEGAEPGVPACPARDTPLHLPSASTSAVLGEHFGESLSRSLFARERQNGEARGTRRTVRYRTMQDDEENTTPVLQGTRSSGRGDGISVLSPFAPTQHRCNASIVPTGVFDSAALSALVSAAREGDT